MSSSWSLQNQPLKNKKAWKDKKASERAASVITLIVFSLIALGIIAALAGNHGGASNAANIQSPDGGFSGSNTQSMGSSDTGSSDMGSTTSGSDADSDTGSATTPSNTSQSCYPLSDEGGCYESGEYCRDSDQGVTGTAGNGESITCEDNDGLRWEPN